MQPELDIATAISRTATAPLIEVKPIQFFAPGIPKGQPRARAFARRMGDKYVARVFDDGSAEGWKAQIATAARPHLPVTPLLGPVRLRVVFYMPRPKGHYRSNGEMKATAPSYHTVKPDTDNLIKAVKDALTVLGAWRDDSQVADERAMKLYSSAGATGASIEIMALAEQQRL